MGSAPHGVMRSRSPVRVSAGCTLDPMASTRAPTHDGGMPLTIRQTQRQALVPAGRNAANDLYDHACDLLASGQALRAAAERDGNQSAIAATLGCLESA